MSTPCSCKPCRLAKPKMGKTTRTWYMWAEVSNPQSREYYSDDYINIYEEEDDALLAVGDAWWLEVVPVKITVCKEKRIHTAKSRNLMHRKKR